MTTTRVWTTATTTALMIGYGCGADESRLQETNDPLCSSVDPARELMIRDVRVVEDTVRTRWTGALDNSSDGAWHFGRLMTNMAGPQQDASDFVRHWLSAWEQDQIVNGFTVPARPFIGSLVIDAWPKFDDGRLDLKEAPLRLLAIVNRMDLRKLAQGSAGEGRFVFGAPDPSGFPTSFTVILEYTLPATTREELFAWANQWHDLSQHRPGSASYRKALQAITDRFAGPYAMPGRPNEGAISQVRTNEIALAGPWELREFRLTNSGALEQSTVAQTPDSSFNGSATLASYINTNEKQILNGVHTIPLRFNRAPFRGGASPNNIDIWTAPGVNNNDARHLVSLDTCNACHGGETQTGFLHVSPRSEGQEAFLSGFLTGITIPDPIDPSVTRTFNDLAARAKDLERLVCRSTPIPAAAVDVGPDASRVH